MLMVVCALIRVDVLPHEVQQRCTQHIEALCEGKGQRATQQLVVTLDIRSVSERRVTDERDSDACELPADLTEATGVGAAGIALQRALVHALRDGGQAEQRQY